ncbi:TlpA family protein disulfide reductase [Belliella aquatica]|uniref:Thioredoxin domain-containing protein n=1 Tax=Belliella aquatica TaxID=1323734 RepID=A0ABQ1M036_9BACT|nr:TlpA disulfide reductase family protein [Belliella aquatica]MCH7406832.1 TlpA family protein disulfide reductase [Belliella aquatica]GGC32378.1 hypothetical protein GCM10010993_09190 [Belliella aquatica]
MKNKPILLLLFNLLTYSAICQEEFKPLTQGDTLPDFIYDKVLYHPDDELMLSDYKGGLLILDFWATWCAPCVASFPKLDSLDRAFGDKLTILPVTYQGKEEVEKLFTRLPKLKTIRKPMIYEDQFLRFILPHQLLPHYVWISPEGTLLAEVGSDQMNFESIQNYLESGILPTQRTKKVVTISDDTPLDEKDAVYKVIMTDYQESRKTIYRYFPKAENGGSRIIASNISPYMYFRIAFKDPNTKKMFPNSQIKVELSNPEMFTTEATGEGGLQWEMQHAKCLQIDFPPSLKDQEQEILQQEVKRMFPYAKPVLEKTEGKAYSLYFMGDSPNFIGDGGESYSEFDFSGFTVRNAAMGYIVNNLSSKYLQHLDGPILNKTGITELVNISIEANLSDLEAINKALEPYSLELREELVEINMLKIVDSNLTKLSKY